MRNDSRSPDHGEERDWVSERVADGALDYRPGVVRDRVRAKLAQAGGLPVRSRRTWRRGMVATWGALGAALALGIWLGVESGLNEVPSSGPAGQLPGVAVGPDLGPGHGVVVYGPGEEAPMGGLRQVAQSAVEKYTPVRAWSGLRATASDLDWVRRTIRPMGRSLLPVRSSSATDGPGA
jgi:hypothetical protein